MCMHTDTVFVWNFGTIKKKNNLTLHIYASVQDI